MNIDVYTITTTPTNSYFWASDITPPDIISPRHEFDPPI